MKAVPEKIARGISRPSPTPPQRAIPCSSIVRAGFSIIELLVVIALIATLSVLATAGFNSIKGGQMITQGAQSVRDVLASARLRAISRNRLVEVRFCRKDVNTPYLWIASLERMPDGTNFIQISRTVSLPQSVVFSDAVAYSPLIANQPEGTNNVQLGSLGSSYKYRSFQFRPDGSTDLPWTPGGNQKYFVTLKSETDTNLPPKNFATVTVDPLNGGTSIYRP